MKGALLLADSASPAWTFATSVKNIISEKYGEVELAEVKIKHFNDKEISVFVPENIRKKEVFFIHDSSKNPQEWLTQLLLVNDALKRASADKIVNVLPYMRYSRQDRKHKPHVPISAKALANTIALYADRVITMDLHADQIQGFYDIPVDSLQSCPTACEYISKNLNTSNLVLVSPDVGAAERVKKFSQRLDLDMAIAYKRRKEAGVISEIALLGDVRGRDVLVIDDMIDTGGTLIALAEKLKQEGALKLFVFSIHPVFSNNAELKLTETYDKILISDTIPYVPRNKVEVISMVDIFAEAIYRAKKGQSISKLFE